MRILKPGEPVTADLFREWTPEETAEAYRLCREAFTAADLQKYTELDEGIPAEEVLAEMEKMLRQADTRQQ